MSTDHSPEAWIALPSPSERKAGARGDDPYNFGFIPAMSGLLATHKTIGPRFLALYAEIMFSPAAALSRAEREMVAAVAAAAQDCAY